MPYFQTFTLESPEIDDKSCIDPNSYQKYINKGLNGELLSILRQNSYAQDFCQGHALNGCCAKLASNLNAKLGLFILSDPNHKNFFQFS